MGRGKAAVELQPAVQQLAADSVRPGSAASPLLPSPKPVHAHAWPSQCSTARSNLPIDHIALSSELDFAAYCLTNPWDCWTGCIAVSAFAAWIAIAVMTSHVVFGLMTVHIPSKAALVCLSHMHHSLYWAAPHASDKGNLPESVLTELGLVIMLPGYYPDEPFLAAIAKAAVPLMAGFNSQDMSNLV